MRKIWEYKYEYSTHGNIYITSGALKHLILGLNSYTLAAYLQSCMETDYYRHRYRNSKATTKSIIQSYTQYEMKNNF